MNTLKIINLSKRYANGTQALNTVSLELTNGMFGLLGPNGSGKSTLMKTIAGLQKPDSGELFLNNTDILQNPVIIKQQLGFLPQDFGVYPKTSAVDLLTHIAILKGMRNDASLKDQVMALLQQTNLFAYRNKEVYHFSGGMRQRFGVAQALLADPRVVILDEPTAGLDPEERNRFNNLLSEIGEDRIIILSTHLVEDVRNLCSNMAIVKQGNIIAQGKPADFIEVLKGKLWQKTISKKDQLTYEQNYRIISSQLISGKRCIHIYSDADPGNGFQPIVPHLEDTYFTLLNTPTT